MRNRVVFGTISIAGAAAWMLLLAAACSSNEPAEVEQAAPVRTVAAERSAIQRIIEARGILYPVNQAAVTPKITAPVQAFYVNRGDHVRKGQLLAVLENRDLVAAVAETRGQYEQAEASYRSTTAASLPEEMSRARSEVRSTKEAMDAAQKLYESRRALFEQGALPRRLVDEANVAYVHARSQYEVASKHLESLEKTGVEQQTREAQATVEAARGRYQAAEAQLSYSQITSPISGVVADRPTFQGETAAAGSPLLTVIDTSRIVARAPLASDQLALLRVGASATIKSADSGDELPGRVSVISPALDPQSTTAQVWIEAANQADTLKPGMAVEVSILAQELKDALVIPSAALLPSEEAKTVVLVVGSDSAVHQREIQTGIRQGGKVQVLRGLQAGERVVIVGGVGLEDGAKVSIEGTDQHE